VNEKSDSVNRGGANVLGGVQGDVLCGVQDDELGGVQGDVLSGVQDDELGGVQGDVLCGVQDDVSQTISVDRWKGEA
jgi:outer membrane lipoprotein SlyB